MPAQDESGPFTTTTASSSADITAAPASTTTNPPGVTAPSPTTTTPPILADGPPDTSTAHPQGTTAPPSLEPNSSTALAPTTAAPPSTTTVPPPSWLVEPSIAIVPDPLISQDPVSIQVARSAALTLSWSAAHASAVNIDPLASGLSAQGSAAIPTVDQALTLVAIGLDGTTQGSPYVINVHTHEDGEVVSGHATITPIDGKITSSKINVGGRNFLDWYSKWRKGKGVNEKMHDVWLFGSDVQSATGFAEIFDNIPTLSGLDAISLNRFVAYFCIMYQETGHAFTPVIEGGDDAYFFEDRVLKTGAYKPSYQHNAGLGNRLAGDQLLAAQKIKDDKDVKRWNGGGRTCHSCRKKKKTAACVQCKLIVCSHFAVGKDDPDPHSYPGDATDAVVTASHECDFYKFRGHGLNQITGRANFTKHVEPFLKKQLQKGIDQLTSEELTAAYQLPEIYLNAFNSFYADMQDAMDALDQDPPQWRDVGNKTNGSEEYADIFEARCKKLVAAMTKEKWSCG